MNPSPIDPVSGLFRVVILGRPNVGKSTLFNRLLGRRRAITDPNPGVTRDVLEEECRIGEAACLLIDTGGYDPAGGGLGKAVSERTLKEAERAGLILFMMDVNEITPADRAFAELMRRYNERILLVINKVDSPKQEDLVWNFHALGFERLIGISAENALNVGALREMIAETAGAVRRSAAVTGPGQDGVRLVILGKPNTGKSTLLNRLLNEEKALVSKEPGTTRDVIEGRFLYRGICFRVMDTAGIRRRSNVKEDVEYYSVNRAIRSLEEADVVLLLLDAREELSDQDKKIAALAERKGRGIVLVLNKWDLMEQGPDSLRAARDRIRFHFPVLGFAPVLSISSLTGQGIRRLLDTAVDLCSQLERRVGTAVLNQALRNWVREYPVPGRGKNIKIRYGTQVQAKPLRFLFFSNRPRSLPRTYTHYLENRIRQEFRLTQVPVRVEFREA